jgi:WD40 repeat protein
VCGTQSRDIQIYDIRSGRHVNTFKGHKGSVQCLQFDENKIVSGSWDTTCIVWDVVHGTVIQELIGHTGCVSSLQFTEQKLQVAIA